MARTPIQFDVHFDVQYVPCPKEQAPAYWNAMRILCELLIEAAEKQDQPAEREA